MFLEIYDPFISATVIFISYIYLSLVRQKLFAIRQSIMMKLSKRQFAAIVIISKLATKKKKKRSVCGREWILRSERDGAYNRLMSELIIEDPMQFFNFVRMKVADFENLATKIAPLVLKQGN